MNDCYWIGTRSLDQESRKKFNGGRNIEHIFYEQQEEL